MQTSTTVVDDSYSTGTIIVIIFVIIIILIIIGLAIWYFYPRNIGNTGPSGPSGPSGSSGSTGNTGPSGPSGPTGNIVRYGDTITIFSNSSQPGANYLSPCGTLGLCSTIVTLRSDFSFDQNQGIANRLRLWRFISSGNVKQPGSPVAYGDTILLVSLAAGLDTQSMGICIGGPDEDPTDIPFNPAIVGANVTPSSNFWTITSASGSSSDVVMYGDIVNFTNNVYNFIGDGLLTTCAGRSPCNDSSGPGCGIVAGLSNGPLNSTNNQWIIRRM